MSHIRISRNIAGYGQKRSKGHLASPIFPIVYRCFTTAAESFWAAFSYFTIIFKPNSYIQSLEYVKSYCFLRLVCRYWPFLARDVIYTSRAYAMMPVRLSVCLSDGSALAHYS